MAGDWIKVELATPDKPEIAMMALELGIDHDAVFGKCVRLWMWANEQSIDGNALSVTKTLLDRITYCNGFANALTNVGWLDGEDGRLTLPNFTRHNGKTAKTRAKTNARVNKHRECNAPSVTKALPEKRREEKSIKEGKETPPATLPALAPKSDPVPYSEILSDFNATFGLSCRWTPKRRQQAQARWRDPDWRDHWQEALERAGPSLFLRGGSDRGWVIDLEFFLRPDTVTKILEGKYDNRQSTNAAGNSAAAREQRNADAFAIVFGEGDS